MDISISAYRNRIGSFIASHSSYSREYAKRKSYKTSTNTIYNLKKLFICLILVSSIVSKLEIIQERKVQDLSGRFGGQFNAPGSLASGTEAVNFFILGGEVSASHFPAMHLSFQDILGVHSAATLRGTQAGQLHSCCKTHPVFYFVRQQLLYKADIWKQK